MLLVCGSGLRVPGLGVAFDCRFALSGLRAVSADFPAIFVLAGFRACFLGTKPFVEGEGRTSYNKVRSMNLQTPQDNYSNAMIP